MLRLLLFMLVLLSLTACNDEAIPAYSPSFSDRAPNQSQQYIFSVHPLHNPQRLFEVFNPLMTYLETHIPETTFKLEASRNYAAYDKKLYAKLAHFSLPNPFQTINAVDKGYRVIAKMGDDANFRGIILTRKDSGIEKVSDLKGKAVSYPAPTALAATMMPQYYLHTHGLDVMQDVDNRFVGSQESSIMNVFLDQTQAGSTWPPPWMALSRERPELAEQLQISWETPPLPNNGVVALPDIDPAVITQVQQLLTNLHQTAEGQAILKRMELSRFELAQNATYQPVRDFIATFSKEVRPVQ